MRRGMMRRSGTRLANAARTATSAANPVYLLGHALLVVAGGALTVVGGAVPIGVGTGFIAAGATGFATFFHVLLQQDAAQRLKTLDEFGILNAFEHRGVAIKPEYDEFLRDAEEGIDILAFGLKHLLEDYESEFAAWATRCRVRFLLLDPHSPGTPKYKHADARDREEGNTEGSTANDVLTFLARTATLRMQMPDRFQVRLYNTLPSVNIFRIDNHMFFGPYLLKKPSRNTPTLLLRRGLLYDRLRLHFDDLWSDEYSKPA